MVDFFKKNGILFLINKCNNNCVICQDSGDFKLGLKNSFEKIKSDINKMVLLGFRHLNIYGGEPFLDYRIYKIIEHIAKKNIDCNIFTNARIFVYQKNVDYLRRVKRVSVITSLFSYRKKIHDCLTGVSGSFEQTVIGIKNLVAAKIPVTATIVLTGQNLDDLLLTANFLNELGVSSLKISGLIDQGKMLNRHDLIPSFKDLKISVNKLSDETTFKKDKIIFEKLPLCVARENEFKFIYEKQHKTKMLIFPLKTDKCKSCKQRFACMCFCA